MEARVRLQCSDILVACLKNHSPYQRILRRELFLLLFGIQNVKEKLFVGLQKHRKFKTHVSFVFLSRCFQFLKYVFKYYCLILLHSYKLHCFTIIFLCWWMIRYWSRITDNETEFLMIAGFPTVLSVSRELDAIDKAVLESIHINWVPQPANQGDYEIKEIPNMKITNSIV